jgi:hypothetical protein
MAAANGKRYEQIVRDLTRRQVISSEIAERLAILPDDRLGLALATLIIDIPHLRREHVDQLIEADTDAQFERALRGVKRQIATPTLDLYAQILFAALIRYLGIADLACRQNVDETSVRVASFVCDKILRPSWGMLSLISQKQDPEIQQGMQQIMKRFVNENIVI